MFCNRDQKFREKKILLRTSSMKIYFAEKPIPDRVENIWQSWPGGCHLSDRVRKIRFNDLLRCSLCSPIFGSSGRKRYVNFFSFFSSLYQKSDFFVPKNETAQPRSQFLHSCICARSWKNLNHSQIHECGNLETKHYNSILEIIRPRRFISGNT